MKKNEIKEIKESNDIERLKKEHALCLSKMGKAHSKTIYINKRLDMERDIERTRKQMNKADFYHIMSQFPKSLENAIECKNVNKMYDEYHAGLRNIASKIYKNDYTTNDIIAASTLFMYLIDTGYERLFIFNDEQTANVFNSIFVNSTGEGMFRAGLDSQKGFYEFYLKLVNYGLDLTSDLEYANITKISGKNYIEIVTVEDPKIVPYHLYTYNYKNFSKSLKISDNRISNSEFVDFSENIAKVKNDVIDAVLDFWNIKKLLNKNGFDIFLNAITLQSYHSFVESYLVKDFNSFTQPVLNINGKYISARKLFECILMKNEIQFSLNQDLLYENCFYFKIPFDEDTNVKYTPYAMLDENRNLKNIKEYVSANAFAGSEINESEEDQLMSYDLGTHFVTNGNENERLTEELLNKFEEEYTPDSNYDFIMQMAERKSSKIEQTNVQIEEEINFEEFQNTTAVNMEQARLEQERLNTEIEKDWEEKSKSKYVSSKEKTMVSILPEKENAKKETFLLEDNNFALPNNVNEEDLNESKIFEHNEASEDNIFNNSSTEEIFNDNDENLIDFDIEQAEFDQLYKDLQADLKETHNITLNDFEEDEEVSFNDQMSGFLSNSNAVNSDNINSETKNEQVETFDFDIDENNINQNADLSTGVENSVAVESIEEDTSFDNNDLLENKTENLNNIENELSTSSVDNSLLKKENNGNLSTQNVDNLNSTIEQKQDSIVISSTEPQQRTSEQTTIIVQQPASEQLQPVTEQLQTVSEQLQNISKQTPQVTEQTTIIVQQPASEQLQPVTEQLQSVSEQLKAMTAQLQSMTNNVQSQGFNLNNNAFDNKQPIYPDYHKLPELKANAKTSSVETIQTVGPKLPSRRKTTTSNKQAQASPKLPPRKAQTPSAPKIATPTSSTKGTAPKLPPRKKA